MQQLIAEVRAVLRLTRAAHYHVSQVLGVSKSSVEIARGHKSRDKTVLVHNMNAKLSAEEHIENVRNALLDAAKK